MWTAFTPLIIEIRFDFRHLTSTSVCNKTSPSVDNTSRFVLGDSYFVLCLHKWPFILRALSWSTRIQNRGALAQDELVYRVSCKSIFEFQYSTYDICYALFCLERHNTQFSLFNANNRQTYGGKDVCLSFYKQEFPAGILNWHSGGCLTLRFLSLFSS